MHKPIRSLLILGVLAVVTIVSIGTWSHHSSFVVTRKHTVEHKKAEAVVVPLDVLVQKHENRQQQADLLRQLGKTGIVQVRLPKSTKTLQDDDSYWQQDTTKTTTTEQEPAVTKLESPIPDCKDVPISPYIRQGTERVGKAVTQLLLNTSLSLLKDADILQKPNHHHAITARKQTVEQQRRHPPKMETTSSKASCHGDTTYWVHEHDSSLAWKLQEVEQVTPETPVCLGSWHLVVTTPYHGEPTPIESDEDVIVWVSFNRDVLLSGDSQTEAHDTLVPSVMDASTASTDWYSRSYKFTSFPVDAFQHLLHKTSSIEDQQQPSLNSKAHSVSSSSDDEQFCTPGMSMVMFMDGFRRSLGGSKKQPSHCLNYYFRTWTLEEVGKFHGAMVFSFLLAILTEGLSALRAIVFSRIRKGPFRKLCLSVLYGLQSFMGYTIMLAAMMYSIEILLAVVIGLVLGNRLFVRDGKVGGAPQRVNDPHRQPLLNR